MSAPEITGTISCDFGEGQILIMQEHGEGRYTLSAGAGTVPMAFDTRSVIGTSASQIFGALRSFRESVHFFNIVTEDTGDDTPSA